MQNKEVPKLKPCPFCGGNAFIGISDRLYIGCNHKKSCICKCDTWLKSYNQDIYTQIKKWNNRKGEE